MDINKIVVLGKMADTPEIKTTDRGSRFATFSVLTTEHWRGNTGDLMENRCYHRCVVWGRLVDFCTNLYEGDRVLVTGKVQTRSYTNAHGEKKWITQINVQTAFKAPLEVQPETDVQTSQPPQPPAPTPKPPPTAALPKKAPAPVTPYTAEDEDDDLPF